MFSDLILRNSRRSRKENGLFFGSLIISIVAFYIILSLSHQDVMLFLREMESDAVNRLLLIVPAFYIMTLGILFFLIYFACKYQLQRRRHEFGVYLMLGMRRSRLFSMLLAEDLVGSVLALLIGLPIAVLLSELISLTTAKLVGLGILGHRFTLSLSAVVLTVIGFLVIKLAAFLILSGAISRQEIGALLSDAPVKAKKQKPAAVYGLAATAGLVMLAVAYTMAIRGTAWQSPLMMLATLLLGMVGTILLFFGMRTLIALLVRIGGSNRKLRIFNFRQIQENVIQQSTALAVSSLLILAALCCFGAGVGIFSTSSQMDAHVLDYTFEDTNTEAPEQVLPNLQAALKESGLEDQFAELFPMRLGHVSTGAESAFTMAAVMDALRVMPQSEDRNLLLNNLSYVDYPYLICLSDYNRLLALAGEPTLTLEPNEAAVYRGGSEYRAASSAAVLNEILSGRPTVSLAGSPLVLTGEVQSTNLVTDRSITLDFALILPDEAFFRCTQGQYSVYINGVLSREASGDAGLLHVFSAVNGKLDAAGLTERGIEYESYLQNMGRQLFYMVAASYITSYLAIIFLAVSNTILGVQFLMSQRRTGRRYQTLIRLGAAYETLCRSARKQINWFVGLPVLVAAAGSMFGVRALFSGILSTSAQTAQKEMLLVSGFVILLLCVVEYIYLTAIKRSSDRYLLTLMEPQRKE